MKINVNHYVISPLIITTIENYCFDESSQFLYNEKEFERIYFPLKINNYWSLIIIFNKFNYNRKDYTNVFISVSFKRNTLEERLEKRMVKYSCKILKGMKLTSRGNLFHIRIHKQEQKFKTDKGFVDLMQTLDWVSLENEQNIITICESEV